MNFEMVSHVASIQDISAADGVVAECCYEYVKLMELLIYKETIYS